MDALRSQLRASQQQLTQLTRSRDETKEELERVNRMPTPCGVGMEVESGGGPTGTDMFVKMLVPGMSAALSEAIQLGDILIAIASKPAATMTPADIRPLVVGARGTPVTFTFMRSGETFDVTLKRGAFGPQHAVVSPEELDGPDGLKANKISTHNRVGGEAGRPSDSLEEYSASLLF